MGQEKNRNPGREPGRYRSWSERTYIQGNKHPSGTSKTFEPSNQRLCFELFSRASLLLFSSTYNHTHRSRFVVNSQIKFFQTTSTLILNYPSITF